LVEGLKQVTLLGQLEYHLQTRVAQLNRHMAQTPRVRIEPISKANHPLLPEYVPQSSRSVLQASQLSVPRQLTRQQFLKWAIPAGVGVVGVTIASRFLGHQSQQPSPTDSSKELSTPLPIASPANPSLSLTAVDYSRLEGYLKAGQWKEANQETGKLLFQAAKKDKEGWLDREAIDSIACDALSKMDELWLKNSDQRFGFSSQRKIYFECGGEIGKYNVKVWECFGDRVGWRLKDNWLLPDEATFGFSAPVGHLPYFRFWVMDNSGYWWGVILMSRLVNCGS
jgi:GUN4-like